MHAAPSLPELQRRFADALMGVETAAADWIAGNGLDPQARVQIYRNLVFNNHVAALRTAYPAVLKLVGEDFFEAAAARYLRNYPTSSGNLQDYGARFSESLAHLPEAAQLTYLPDVARLEWARQESYLATDATPLNPGRLSEIVEDKQAELKLTLHPSIRLVKSTYPVWDIWMFCQEAAPQHLNLAGGAQTVLVWRDANQIAMQKIADGCQHLVAAFTAGEPLSAAYEQAIVAEADFDLSACLHWLFTNGLVTGITTS